MQAKCRKAKTRSPSLSRKPSLRHHQKSHKNSSHYKVKHLLHRRALVPLRCVCTLLQHTTHCADQSVFCLCSVVSSLLPVSDAILGDLGKPERYPDTKAANIGTGSIQPTQRTHQILQIIQQGGEDNKINLFFGRRKARARKPRQQPLCLACWLSQLWPGRNLP